MSPDTPPYPGLMHYLDHAATTPTLPEVREAVAACLEEDFGNPSSLHGYGRRARQVVEDARDKVALAIGADPSEIVFTGGGTEADNLALQGATYKRRGNGDHIVVSAFEHHAVLDTADWLAKQGWDVTRAPVTEDGLVEPAAVTDALKPSTVLVSVMAVNNEVGTIQDIAANASSVKEANRRTLVHTDAVQALGNVPVDVGAWGVDLASFAAHKLGGPKGVGALYVRSGVPVEAILHGGGQERGIRSGTLNVPAISGFGVAAEIAAKEVGEKADRLTSLRTKLFEGMLSIVPDLQINGHATRRIPGNLNVAIPGADGETLLLLLDRAGIACSAGSACASGAIDPSHVLTAMGIGTDRAGGSLRFSLGRASTQADVDAVLAALPEVVTRARRAA
ncbi:MAG: cysteine desulfurase [Actinomycetota bacterium]|nr:cysteine desulfurase [Actinomycetota bacterium]